MKSLFLMSVAVAFIISSVQVSVVFAQPDGASLLEERCSVCHPSSRPKSKKKTPEQWETTVNRMMGKGAKLTEQEKVVLLDFLSKTYKP